MGTGFSPASLARIAHTANKEQYGLGWWIYEDERGHTRLNHGGTWFGYITTMMGDKDAGIAVYAATNTSPTQGTYRVADAALRLARGEAVSLEDRQPVAVDLAVLERYEGLYRDPMFDLPHPHRGIRRRADQHHRASRAPAGQRQGLSPRFGVGVFQRTHGR